MMYAIRAVLLIVAAINFAPVIGVISAEQIKNLYGISLESDDLIILMRHRAILFGLLGTFIAVSAFRPAMQLLACSAGLVSMVTFVLLAYSADTYGDALDKAVVLDIVASIALVVVLTLRNYVKV